MDNFLKSRAPTQNLHFLFQLQNPLDDLLPEQDGQEETVGQGMSLEDLFVESAADDRVFVRRAAVQALEALIGAVLSCGHEVPPRLVQVMTGGLSSLRSSLSFLLALVTL